MRRLFWTFPDGLPGAGLLLMRLATGCALLYQAVAEWPDDWLSLASARPVAEGLTSIFLVVGFGTPFWGAATAATQLWRIHAESDQLLTHALLATLGVSLALLGAGASSIDAWIFGWRRIDVKKARRGQDHLAREDGHAGLERSDGEHE